MRHDTGAGRELIRQFDEAKVLAIEHTCIESQFGKGCRNAGHGKSYGTFHFATSHLGVNDIIIERVEAEQICCHLASQRERRAISGRRAQRVAVANFISSLHHLQIIGQAFGIGAEPKSE